jgi:hypothetical protein
VKLVSEQSSNGRTSLRFVEVSSICPFNFGPDSGTVEIDYAPGRDQRQIHSDGLETYLTSLQGVPKGIAMEIIPVEVLKFCIQDCLSQGGSRNAAPDWISVRYVSGTGKTWGMKANVRFEREVTEQTGTQLVP